MPRVNLNQSSSIVTGSASGIGEASEAFKAHLGASVLFPKRLGFAEELAFTVMECITNPYMNAEVIRMDGGIRMPPK